MDYSLDKLIETFTNHAIIFQNNREKFVKDNPETDAAKDVNFDFNISLCFKIICEEIKKLKNINECDH